MSKRSKGLFILGMFVLLFVSGCACSDNQVHIMDIILDSPVTGGLVSSLLPNLSWHNSEDCEVDYYHVYVKEHSRIGGGNNYDTPDGNTSFTLTGTPLEPGKEYTWIVEAREDGERSEWSEPSFFYTGPVCSGETLVAPELRDPGNAAWLMKETIFNWIYPGGCLPTSYDFEFSRDAAFTDIYLAGTTTELYASHMLMSFPDCSSMFWRVRANDGTTSGP